MSVNWKGTTDLVEQARTYSRGEKASTTQNFIGPHATCVSSLPWPGALGSGDFASWRVVSSQVQPLPGAAGKLSIQWEAAASGAGATLPRARLRITPTAFQAHLIRHPRYAALRTATGFATALWRYEFPKDDTEKDDARALIVSIGNAASTGKGTEFAAKLDAGLVNVPITGLRCEIESYSWAFPTMTVGGTVGTTGPTLPDSGSWPSGYVFRRLCDALGEGDSYYILTSVWEAGPDGAWDADLGI